MNPITTAAFAASLATAIPVSAQEVTLTFADWQVPAAFTTREAAGVFMEKARELSGGEIDFEYFPAEQLGKTTEMLRLVQTGVADMAHISPAHITENFPLSTVLELPGMPLDSCTLASAFYEMAQPGGILYKEEFEPNGIRLLVAGNLGPYSILTTERPIKALSDLSGLNMRTAGGPMEMTANALGANAVRMTGSETLPSLSRGTLDGVFWPIPLIADWGLEDAIGHMTTNLSTGSYVVTYSISDRKWNSLTTKQQEALMEAGRQTTQEYCQYVNNIWKESRDELENRYGIVAHEMPDDEVAKAEERFETVLQSWQDSLDKRGLPGQQVLTEFRERVSQ